MPRSYSAWHGSERTADICVLAFGLVLGVCGATVLIGATLRWEDQSRRLIGVGAYAAGLLAMLGCSLLYRTATEPRRRQFLRRLDHAAIFAMIAGSATPLALARGGIRGMVVAAALWAVAALGIGFKLRFPIGGIRGSAIIYLLLGWISLVAIASAVSGEILMLIAAGGAFYSIGVLCLMWRRLRYRLAIWHSFVLAGAACHYAAILGGAVLA